jgi:molybdopterin molybdotransferase
MITVEGATRIIMEHCPPPGDEHVALEDAGGRILAEDIIADTDLPPFDRVMMDGIGVQESDLIKGNRVFRITGIQRAGMPQISLEGENNCLEVMTGAVCPAGVNVVIPYEMLETDGTRATVNIDSFRAGLNIHHRGSDYRAGEILVARNQKVGIPETGIAASCGMTSLLVRRKPRCIIISTGDELVEIHAKPESHQIRRSGVYAIRELLRKHEVASALAHASDDEAALHEVFSKHIRQYDLIIVTGGVSKGKFDLVPQVLENNGINCLFHRIAQKPGKPMWFGTNGSTTVFALPGNPVSSLMCATRYLLPWVRKYMGYEHRICTAILEDAFELKGQLTQFAAVSITTTATGSRHARIIRNNGSGDYAGLFGADGFVELNADKKRYEKGDEVEVFLF